MQQTKIICTMGPATENAVIIDQLLAAGMNVARLNFSHGTHEQHKTMFNLLRERALAGNYPLAILQDLQGPKIRLANLQPATWQLQVNQTIKLKPQHEEAIVTEAEGYLPVVYEHLCHELHVDSLILLDDGKIHMKVTDVANDQITCTVLQAGAISSRKGISFPETQLSIPAMTDKDWTDLQFGLTLGVDYVALSFVRDHHDLLKLKQHIPAHGPQIIAKLERKSAIEDLDNILEITDGIMVARGDLGVELGLPNVPVIQKSIVSACNNVGCFEIVATQMLESMITNATPTRAEVSDVANAVFDGADAVMLSAETAVGKFPIEAVTTLHETITAAENSIYIKSDSAAHLKRELTANNAIAKSAISLAKDLKLQAIVLFTYSGHTAQLLASYRPPCPVYAFTSDQSSYHKMSLYWGITPILHEKPQNAKHLFESIHQVVYDRHLVEQNGSYAFLGRLHMEPAMQNTFLQIVQNAEL